MAWNTLSSTQVAAQFTAAELAAVNAAAGAENLAGITANTVSEVRGYIRAGGYTLGAGNTIPDALRNATIVMSTWRFFITLAQNDRIQSKQREGEYTRAIELLQRVADGNFAIEAPTTADDSTSSASVLPSIAPRTRTYNRSAADGL